jgi:molybdenum cofactor guanylyltransferase
MRRGAIILCGGKSSRMGREKATLPFGPERMLQRVVRLLSETVAPRNIVIACARGQSLPPLPGSVTVAHDQEEFRGPLQGLATGILALGDSVDAFYATGCDVPLLVPAFVDRMFDLLGDHDVVAPRDGEYYHPLAAVYRPTVLDRISGLLVADRLRPRDLFEEVRTLEIPVDDLREVDPQLTTLLNINSPDDYASALAAAGFAFPQG